MLSIIHTRVGPRERPVMMYGMIRIAAVSYSHFLPIDQTTIRVFYSSDEYECLPDAEVVSTGAAASVELVATVFVSDD